MTEKADYSKLIDEETWAFIKRTAARYPDDTVDRPIEEQRKIYDAMCREFFAGYPKEVTAETSAIDAGDHRIPIRSYARQGGDRSAFVLYYHGGGFVVGGLESHDDVCAEICHRTGYPVVSVDYRMAPENAFPDCFNDALTAFEWASSQVNAPIVLVGDSAGGNLAAAVCHATRSHAIKPVGLVAVYPGFSGDYAKNSCRVHAEAPLLTRHDLKFYSHVRARGADVTGDPRAAPLADSDFSGLPPVVIISAECDPLSDDGRDYRDAILAAGGKAVWFNEKGLVHGYLRARNTVKRARDSFSRIVAAVDALGRGEWPYDAIGD